MTYSSSSKQSIHIFNADQQMSRLSVPKALWGQFFMAAKIFTGLILRVYCNKQQLMNGLLPKVNFRYRNKKNIKHDALP